MIPVVTQRRVLRLYFQHVRPWEFRELPGRKLKFPPGTTGREPGKIAKVPKPTGGLTAALIKEWDPSGANPAGAVPVAKGLAVCSKTDRFDAEYGRHFALERALASPNISDEEVEALVTAYVQRDRHARLRDMIAASGFFTMLPAPVRGIPYAFTVMVYIVGEGEPRRIDPHFVILRKVFNIDPDTHSVKEVPVEELPFALYKEIRNLAKEVVLTRVRT